MLCTSEKTHLLTAAAIICNDVISKQPLRCRKEREGKTKKKCLSQGSSRAGISYIIGQIATDKPQPTYWLLLLPHFARLSLAHSCNNCYDKSGPASSIKLK